MQSVRVEGKIVLGGLIARVSPQGIAFIREDGSDRLHVFALDLLPPGAAPSLAIGLPVTFTFNPEDEEVVAVELGPMPKPPSFSVTDCDRPNLKSA